MHIITAIFIGTFWVGLTFHWSLSAFSLGLPAVSRAFPCGSGFPLQSFLRKKPQKRISASLLNAKATVFGA